MIIRSNPEAIHSISTYNSNNSKIKKSLEKVSSGLKINRAVDNASGLAITQKMKAQIVGFEQSELNIKDGLSLTNTAEAAVENQINIMHRVRELSVRAGNDIYMEDDRRAIQTEIDSLLKEYERIADSTIFNGKSLLSVDAKFQDEASLPRVGVYTFDFSSFSKQDIESLDGQTVEIKGNNGDILGKIKFTKDTSIVEEGYANVDINTADTKEFTKNLAKSMEDLGMTINVTGSSLVAKSFAVDAKSDYNPLYFKGLDANPGYQTNIIKIKCGANSSDYIDVEIKQTSLDVIFDDSSNKFSVSNQLDAGATINNCDIAIEYLSKARSTLGDYTNRMEYAYNNVSYTNANAVESRSRLEDTDMAKEMLEYTKTNILQYATQSMMAQSSKVPKNVIQLLQA